jgi:hypothetical protein
MPLLKSTATNWQPQDFLPHPESDTFLDEVAELRQRAKGISDDHLVRRRELEQGLHTATSLIIPCGVLRCMRGRWSGAVACGRSRGHRSGVATRRQGLTSSKDLRVLFPARRRGRILARERAWGLSGGLGRRQLF